MQTEVTDDELRALLSKYMEVVPPVTDTTRQVLLAKLEKYLISDLPPENLGDKSIENLSSTSVVRSPKKSPKVDLPSTNAAKALNPENSQNSLTVDTDNVLRISSPNLKLSPSALEYATRLPIYRRRSIHPDHPGLASPYSDLVLPTSPYKNRFPLQQNSERLVSSGSQKTNWFHGPLDCVFELFAAFVGLLCALGSVFSPMQTEVTDDELRALLSKYMEVVPPVTDTTRQVLLAKLEKYLISDLPPENLGDKSIENLSSTSVVRSPKKSPKVDLPSTNAAKALNPENSQNSLTVDTDNVLRISSPNLKLSPSALEYATRLPIYRRRSIHPDHPGLASPYSDLVLPTSPYKKPISTPAKFRTACFIRFTENELVPWSSGLCIELFAAFVGLLCALGSVFSRK
ncbi:hypothetical protein AHF37_06245 [Paragonimus kellicotti]|nr:hypothetical protein AHF37_06245 [Paragonimus kellicotti]